MKRDYSLNNLLGSLNPSVEMFYKLPILILFYKSHNFFCLFGGLDKYWIYIKSYDTQPLLLIYAFVQFFNFLAFYLVSFSKSFVLSKTKK